MFTPGPWRLARMLDGVSPDPPDGIDADRWRAELEKRNVLAQQNDGGYLVVDSIGRIAHVAGRTERKRGSTEPDLEAEANAKLIVEAPAMYKMVARLARNGGCTCEDLGEGYICDVCEAKEILARIEGGK